VSYLLSLDLTSPTVAQVLIQLAPMFLLFGGVIVFRERFAARQWAGFAVLVAGLLIFFHDRYAEVFALQTRLGLGVAVMLFSALVWSVYAMAQKQLLAQLASGQVLFLLYAGAVPLLLPPAQLAQVLELNGLQLGMLVFWSRASARWSRWRRSSRCWPCRARPGSGPRACRPSRSAAGTCWARAWWSRAR
jgi:drug/metabolite transporter (DMT)-like permease